MVLVLFVSCMFGICSCVVFLVLLLLMMLVIVLCMIVRCFELIVSVGVLWWMWVVSRFGCSVWLEVSCDVIIVSCSGLVSI